MSLRKIGWRMTLVCYCLLWLCAAHLRAQGAARHDEFFEKRVRPLLIEKCQECHASDTEASGGLLLDSRAGWQRGGDSGPAVVPGKPEESRLIKAVEYSDPDLQMPPEGPLSAAEVSLLKKWIADGAIDPREASAPLETKSVGLPLERAAEHWAYRPLSMPEVPSVDKGFEPANAIDAFIVKQLVAADVPPAGSAGRAELLRRMTFDLHGLPPSAESICEFQTDTEPDAVERVVDRLLASPRFGERMARHWMDVARYAESLTLRGFVLPQAWRYRDYLISSFREDRPFDAMIREQIAGDLLEHADLDRRAQQIVATTFLTLGNTNLEEQDKTQLEMDFIDEQLEVIGRVFMGQTIGCARCHDHKFDPIPTSDYYALAGIFRAAQSMEHENVSKWIEKPLPTDPEQERRFGALEASLKQVVADEKRIEKLLGKKTSAKADAVIDPAALPGIVIDDAAAMKVGDWKESGSVRPFIGHGYLTDGNARGIVKTLTFQPVHAPEGTMAVRLAYTPGQNRSTRTLVRVFSADSEKSVIINQREAPSIDGVWFPLGEFRFEKDGQAFVLVSNEGSDGHVIADAVQFLPSSTETKTLAAAKDASSSKEDRSSKQQTQRDKKLAAELNELKSERKRLEGVLAARPRSMTIVESLPARDIPIHIRGSVHNLGSIVPRGFLRCADFEQRSPLSSDTSGRREFAEWLSDPRHPLTPRVFVNRLWIWLYGAALVRSVDNFGTTGEAPTHPELLDYLASDFINHGWSPQVAMRRMLLSATYQRATDADERAFELDPENRLFGRSQRKRLDVESMRDAMLAISGELTFTAGGSTLRPGIKDDYRYEHAPALRAVYQPVLRNSLPELYDAFDFPNPSIPAGQRAQSVVAPQALALLNSTWVHARALAAAESIDHQFEETHASDDAEWRKDLIELIFDQCLGRRPTTIEIYTARALFDELEQNQTERRQIIARLVHGLFASVDFRYLD